MSNILPVRTVMVEIAHIQQAVDYLILAVDEGKKQRYRKEHIARIEQAQEAITRAVRGGLDAAIRDAMGTKPGQFGSRLRFLVAQIRTTAWSICDPSYDAVSHPAVQQMRAAADKLHTLWQRLACMDESASPAHIGNRPPGKKPLNPTQQKAFDYIRQNPGCDSITVSGHINRSDVHFRKSIVPVLKRHGVTHVNGCGYYPPPM